MRGAHPAHTQAAARDKCNSAPGLAFATHSAGTRLTHLGLGLLRSRMYIATEEKKEQRRVRDR